MQQPSLSWDIGTAYDFFVSILVLHEPGRWGVRGAWAAGVRSRLSADQRDFLKQFQTIEVVPTHWIHSLPAPRDSQTILNALAQLSPEQRTYTLLHGDHHTEQSELTQFLNTITERGSWDKQDTRQLRKLLKQIGFDRNAKSAECILHWWTNPTEFGERILETLQAYYDVFFAEEEQRIQPYIEEALAKAQAAAATKLLHELIEHLTGGVQLDRARLTNYEHIILTPSFWVTPFLVSVEPNGTQQIYIFGARPDHISVVPGEAVPDTLYLALKALADPTRLKILKYLSTAPHTPTELARKLRLRPPTVIHHLDVLRLAQLVYLALSAEGKRYAARREALRYTLDALDQFLEPDDETTSTDATA